MVVRESENVDEVVRESEKVGNETAVLEYSLRPRAHCYQLPIKDDINFIPRILYSTLNEDKIPCCYCGSLCLE